ncbi:hypothetical protein [Hyalangium versicolor]|uniref:hypothetical protein n=1 Tax=Hyalangium versicolor TaxID=2861190 RepID=UPI001CCEFE63|nr:hypothetical protein [Hyalangium versicolor]
MRQWVSWKWGPVVVALLVAGRAAAVSPNCPKERLCLKTGEFKRVLVMPKRLLPTRLRVSFDSEVVPDDKAVAPEDKPDWMGPAGQHVELEWDPLQSTRVPRTVNLGPGQWSISFTMEPLPLSSSDPQRLPVYLSASFEETSDPAIRMQKTFKGTFHYLAERVKKPSSPAEAEQRTISVDALDKSAGAYAPVEVTFQVLDLPSLEETVGGLSATEGGAIGGRSLDVTASQAVNELFSILAELAFEQASARAFQVLSDRLTTLTCSKLRMSTLLSGVPKNDVTRFVLRPPDEPTAGDEFTKDLLLPNTCSAVKGLRMEELATAGSTLLDALARDVLWVTSSALLPSLTPVAPAPGQPAPAQTPEQRYTSRFLKQLAIMLGNQLVNHRTLELRQSQLLLLEASRHGWKKEEASAYTCGVQVAFAAMAQCHASGSCDARQIVELVRYPERYFNLSASGCDRFLGEQHFDELRAVWPDLEQMIERGLQVLQPSSRTPAREHLRLTVELGLELVERGAASSQDATLAALLKDMRLVALGIVDQDVQPVLVGVGRLIRRARVDFCAQAETDKNKNERGLVCNGQLPEDLTRATHLIAAVTSYVRTYSDSVKADARQLEAAREARKNAIRSLILATTDRTQRDGERIVSLGTAVGASVGGLQTVDGNAQWLTPQLSLPVGIALQRLPDTRASGCENWSGWHLQFSFADLGQYVAYDKDGDVTSARWDTALTLGLQAGVLFGDTRDQFLIAADVRYSPTLFTEPKQDSGGGAFRAGIMVAYYVPFFDFN